MKKSLNIMLILFAVITITVSCVSIGEYLKTQPFAYAATTRNIKIFIPSYEDVLVKDIYTKDLNEFRKENPGLNVEVITSKASTAKHKLFSLMQEGDTPDLVITNLDSLKQLVTFDYLEPLDPFLTKKFKNTYNDTISSGNIKVKQYGLPIVSYANEDSKESSSVNYFAIPCDSKNKDIAWKFIKSSKTLQISLSL